MIDYHQNLVSALNGILPTYYELQIDSTTGTPCITYIEKDNRDYLNGDTIQYSVLSYTIKVWANEVSALQENAVLIDAALKPLGFKRISSQELYDVNSTMKQKMMVYEAIGIETEEK